MSVVAVSSSSSAPTATSWPRANAVLFRRSFRVPAFGLGQPLEFPAQRSAAVGRRVTYRQFFTAVDSSLWRDQVEEPRRCGGKAVAQRVVPAVPRSIGVDRRDAQDVAAAAPEVDTGQDAGAIAGAGRKHVEVEALGGFTTGPVIRSLAARTVSSRSAGHEHIEHISHRTIQGPGYGQLIGDPAAIRQPHALMLAPYRIDLLLRIATGADQQLR
jgi:hypothetical protein